MAKPEELDPPDGADDSPKRRKTDGAGPTGVLILTFEGYKYVIGFLILFAVVVVGFFIVDAQGNRIEALTEDNTASIAQIERLGREVVTASRDACGETNVVRNNQYVGIEEQIKTTEATLKKPGGLGPLEGFREQIEAQNEQRKERRDDLLVEDNPQEKRPWLVDCVAAYP